MTLYFNHKAEDKWKFNIFVNDIASVLGKKAEWTLLPSPPGKLSDKSVLYIDELDMLCVITPDPYKVQGPKVFFLHEGKWEGKKNHESNLLFHGTLSADAVSQCFKTEKDAEKYASDNPHWLETAN